MNARRSVLTLGLIAGLLSAPRTLAGTEPFAKVPDSCPVTAVHGPWFVPPAPYPAAPPSGTVWIGSDSLWVMAKADGVWRGIGRPTSQGLAYRNKQFWWRPGYHGPSEPTPALHVRGRRLGGPAAEIQVGPATNAHDESFGGWTMLVMPEIPQGCWELTGQYGDDRVSLVVWVEE